LVGGRTKSCGCFAKESRFTKSLKHGHARKGQVTKTFRAWQNMIRRCYEEGNNRYKYYGAKGIKVCKSWLNSFEDFLADMGECPLGKSLDRIDPFGDYCPENCRWADASLQMANRRPYNKLGIRGITKIINKKSIKYKAEIRVKGKLEYFGTFDCLEEAIAAFNKRHKEIYNG
jgi:hypothetical protein